MLVNILVGLLSAVAGLLSALYAVTSNSTYLQPQPVLHTMIPLSDDEAILEKFSGLLKIPTLANDKEPNHIGAAEAPIFQSAVEYIKAQYKEAVTDPLEFELVADYTVLITWRGSDESLAPALFISHYDIVPAPPQNWTYPPFSGKRADDGFIYGRGALDVKISTSAVLSAICELRTSHPEWKPKRTLMFTSGHDEELGGIYGATGVANLLKSRGIKLGMILDEGGAVMKAGIGKMVTSPVALVGTAEKGFIRVEVNVTGKRAGHASMPPRKVSETATSLASKLISQVERRPPAPAVTQSMFDFFHRASFYTENFFIKHILRAVSFPAGQKALAYLLGMASDESSALVRMTVATTDIHSGVAYNVIPMQANLGFNCRIPPGKTGEDCVEYLKSLLTPEELTRCSFKIDEKSRGVPSPVTSATGWAFQMVERAIGETITLQDAGSPLPGNVGVVPYLMLAGTDSKRFYDVVDWETPGNGILRFAPLFMGPNDLARVHSIDERISEANVLAAVRFYYRLIELLGA